TKRSVRFARVGTRSPLSILARTTTHRRHSLRWLDRADQHGAGAAFVLAHKVQTPVNSVRAIDIGITRWPEHYCIAFGAADVGMRGRVGMVIGLDFDDQAARAVD